MFKWFNIKYDERYVYHPLNNWWRYSDKAANFRKAIKRLVFATRKNKVLKKVLWRKLNTTPMWLRIHPNYFEGGLYVQHQFRLWKQWTD